jgi:Flp pilus assembly protein TadG
MPRPRSSFLNRLRRAREGATAVEFALLAAPLIALVLAGLQTAIVFFFDQALQTATQKAARQLMTGAAQTSSLTQTQFRTAVCANLPGEFQCANVMVDVQSAASFPNLNTSSLTLTYNSNNSIANTFQYNPGGPGDIVIMRVLYDWPVIGGPLGFGLSNQPDGGHLLMATAVFKNEPYQ